MSPKYQKCPTPLFVEVSHVGDFSLLGSALPVTGQEAKYSPRLVVLEYGENLPFNVDLLVRYTPLPILGSMGCLSGRRWCLDGTGALQNFKSMKHLVF